MIETYFIWFCAWKKAILNIIIHARIPAIAPPAASDAIVAIELCKMTIKYPRNIVGTTEAGITMS